MVGMWNWCGTVPGGMPAPSFSRTLLPIQKRVGANKLERALQTEQTVRLWHDRRKEPMKVRGVCSSFYTSRPYLIAACVSLPSLRKISAASPSGDGDGKETPLSETG